MPLTPLVSSFLTLRADNYKQFLCIIKNIAEPKCGPTPQVCKGFEYSFPADVYSFAITVYELLHPAHQVPWADISCARRDTFLTQITLRSVCRD